jgi:hypothetical protein
VPKELKIRVPDERSDVPLGPRIEIVDTKNIVAIPEETFAEMGTQEPGPSGH